MIWLRVSVRCNAKIQLPLPFIADWKNWNEQKNTHNIFSSVLYFCSVVLAIYYYTYIPGWPATVIVAYTYDTGVYWNHKNNFRWLCAPELFLSMKTPRDTHTSIQLAKYKHPYAHECVAFIVEVHSYMRVILFWPWPPK